MVLVKVKHGKEQYECQFDTSKDVATFKAALEKLTGVPPERQTLMSKGCWIGTLKDDKDLSTLKPIKDGHLVTLMGSSVKVPDAPAAVRIGLHIDFTSFVGILTPFSLISHSLYRLSNSLRI